MLYLCTHFCISAEEVDSPGAASVVSNCWATVTMVTMPARCTPMATMVSVMPM